MRVDPSIFKAYDIRGIYPDPLREDVAYAVGRAFVKLLACAEVVVGRDMRLSSPAIKEHLLRGLTDQGADIVDIGMVGTDQYYYACATLELPGLMVTASHNPPEYCGFKMVRKMPAGHWSWTEGAKLGNVPQSSWGCDTCKMRLCRRCFRMEIEDGKKPHPDAWDHRRKELLARCVACP